MGFITIEEKAQQLAEIYGVVISLFYLGRCFDTGDGVQQNSVEAAHYYHLAANEGLAEAQYNLGCCFYNGEGVTSNIKTALEYFYLAAKQEYAPALHSLGSIMELKAPVQAANFYARAANLNYAQSQYNLGVLYDNGHGVEQNFAEAAHLYSLAAASGLAEAQFNLACSYEMGQGVMQNFSEAVFFYTQAADQGHPLAQYNLAQCYLHGRGVAANAAGAEHYLTLCATALPDVVPFVNTASPVQRAWNPMTPRPRAVSFAFPQPQYSAARNNAGAAVQQQQQRGNQSQPVARNGIAITNSHNSRSQQRPRSKQI